MACICQVRFNSENKPVHSEACDKHNYRLAVEKVKWNNQDHQCSGSGYAHKPHGKCSGYSTDRT